MIREAVRQFVDAEIRPRRDELEHGDLPPYDIIRSLFKTFGMDAMARESFKRHVERQRLAEERGEQPAGGADDDDSEAGGGGGGGSMMLLPIIELCRCSPGIVGSMGVSRMTCR